MTRGCREMVFVKGMRDKLEKYLDVTRPFVVEMNILGNATYDCCCFGVDASGRLSNEEYMIFYNQVTSPKHEIHLRQNGNVSCFDINLNNIPNEITKLVFTISIDGSGTMAEINSFSLCVKQDDKDCISVINTKKDFTKEMAIISAEIYKKNGWKIAAISNGFNGGLDSLLTYFGGIEDTNVSKPQNTKTNYEETTIPKPDVVQMNSWETTIPKPDVVQMTSARVIHSNTEKISREKELFNARNNSGEPTLITFKYNPYTVESTIMIDGNPVQPPNKLFDLKNERIQVWIDQLLPILVDLCNDSSYCIQFYGLALDYDDLYETIKEYCLQHADIEVCLEFTEVRSSDDRLSDLEKLFEEMQRDCPFEDLKTKQIRDNFYNAISSEFEVSVIATMSSGKSTLINALLSRELMPSKNEACTAAIAKIKDNNVGDIFTAEYRNKKNQVLGAYTNLSLTDMEEMNANPDTAFIDIEGNIPNIDSSGIRLVLVDTPGPNNSRTEEHKNHTYRVIKEKTKPMVLYVLNATQLQTNDDYTLLSTVAEAMKVGGKQSKDRFIFAVNKIDQFDPDKESVQVALQHVREYLQKFDIENPNIFPTSAETAKVIRMYQSGAQLTKGQSKTLRNCEVFI